VGNCTFSYEPYGELESGITCSLATCYRYAGMEWDVETLRLRSGQAGFDHTWFRQYDDKQARWTSVDPLPGSPDSPQSVNRYGYVLNDPINFIDPLGLKCYAVEGRIRCDVWAPDPGTGWSPGCQDIYLDGISIGNTCFPEAGARRWTGRDPGDRPDRPLRNPSGGDPDRPDCAQNPSAPGCPGHQRAPLIQAINCAAKNSSNFTVAFVLGWDDTLLGNFFLGSSPISPLIVLATEPNAQNASAAASSLGQEAVSQGVRPATAALANTRVGPNIQTLNNTVTGPRFGATPVGKPLTGTISLVTKGLAKVPILPFEASVFAFSFLMCGQ